MVAGRIEAQIKVPTGGAAASASLGALSSAVTVTVPAANYFHTAAGGVSSLLTVLQQQLNDNVQGYPQTAAAMQAAVGYGTWSAGWLFNIASGNDTGVFGGVTMTAVSTPTYGTAGPRSGIDKAIGFDSAADAFSGANVYNVDATSDLCIAVVGKFSATPPSNAAILTKYPTANPYWYLFVQGSTIKFECRDAAANTVSSATASLPPVGEWFVLIACLDRGATNAARVAWRTLSGASVLGATSTTATLNTLTNAGNFLLGASTGDVAPTTMNIAAVYVGTGVGAASGLSTNLSTALSNFAGAVNSFFAVSLDTASTGRITISNSFWPASVAFTSTALRDVLGFAYDVDYPQTPAQMVAALGYGGWTTGTANAWLCNEAAGNLAPIFGGTTLTATTPPTYSTQGARGGADKAITLDTTDVLQGGVVHAIGATDDLLVVAVAKSSSTSTFDHLVGQGTAGDAAHWSLYKQAGSMRFRFTIGGVATDVLATYTPLAGEHYVVVAAVDRAAGRARVCIQALTSGSQNASASTVIAASSLASANNFIVGLSGGFGGNLGVVDLSYLAVVSGAGVAAGVPAAITTAVSNFTTYMKSQTSTMQARGLWLPNDFISLDGDPRRAPVMSDARRTMSPTGQVLTLVGNTYKRHTNVVYPYVTIDRVWDAEATYENGSWEEFVLETQLGQGSTWFLPGSAVQIYDHNNVQVGVDANVAGWYMIGVDDVSPRKAVDDYTGLWRIEIPMIVAEGS